MPISIRKCLLSLALSAWLMGPLHSESVRIEQLDLSTPQEALPYHFGYFTPTQYPEWQRIAADLNGDGVVEFVGAYSHKYGDEQYSSAIVVARDPAGAEVRFQYNGRYATARQPSVSCLDCIGSPADDIIITRAFGDTIFFQILSCDSSLNMSDTSFVVAAIADSIDRLGGWHTLRIDAIAAMDLNGDGHKDLLFSRCAKPEQAFERAFIAFDIVNNKMIWQYPISSGLDRTVFGSLRLADGTNAFVFSLYSPNNNYVSDNGLRGDEAYLLSVDREGRERWRHKLGSGFCYPRTAFGDVGGDGKPDVLVVVPSSSDSEVTQCTLQRFDCATGKMLGSSEPMAGLPSGLHLELDSMGSVHSVFVSIYHGRQEVIFRMGADLTIERAVASLVAQDIVDLNADQKWELLTRNDADKFAVLDMDLKLLAWANRNEGFEELAQQENIHQTIWTDGLQYAALSYGKRSVLFYAFARYKWFLAVILAATSAGLFFVRWIRQLYLSAAGVPGLDKVDALVMVLDRRGRVTFVNEHSLARNLIGAGSPRGKHYERLFAKQAQSLLHLIERSYSQPLATLQEQLEVEVDGTAANLLVATYPRLDPNNRFLGKVVVVENITNRVDWQRKVVLGEAAQRWIHNLKNSLATARLYLDNLEEDPRLDDRVRGEVLPDYLPAIRTQIVQTAETAGKVLRFSSIRKPEPIECEINALVDSAVGPYSSSPKPNLTVAIKQQPDLPPVEVDPGQIREALDNLLSNAVFAMKKGGKLTIATRLAEDLPPGNGRKVIEIVVEDTGTGIPQTDLDKIFQPGFSKSGSTGVGLALVKEIIENHGGEVTVESCLGQGTRFAVHLPVERA